MNRLSWIVLVILFVQSAAARAELGTIVSAGLGLGESTTQGDFTQALEGTVFLWGVEYDIDNSFFLARGLSSIHDDYKQMDLIWGYGNRYLKLGTGFSGLETSMPSNPRQTFDTSGHNATNENARIDLSITSIPIYLRFKPITQNNFSLVIDGFVGMVTRGSMTFPLFETRPGEYAYVHSENTEQGGNRGYAIAATWRLAHPMLAVSLEYSYREATMEKQTSYIKSDPFRLYGQVSTPAITFQNRALVLKLVLVR